MGWLLNFLMYNKTGLFKLRNSYFIFLVRYLGGWILRLDMIESDDGHNIIYKRSLLLLLSNNNLKSLFLHFIALTQIIYLISYKYEYTYTHTHVHTIVNTKFIRIKYYVYILPMIQAIGKSPAILCIILLFS